MFQLFRTIVERLKATLLASAGLDFEAQFVAREAERKAHLLREAVRYQEEGLHGIAQQLRRRAETMRLEKPLDSVLPSIAHGHEADVSMPRLSEDANGVASTEEEQRRLSLTSPRKWKRRPSRSQ